MNLIVLNPGVPVVNHSWCPLKEKIFYPHLCLRFFEQRYLRIFAGLSHKFRYHSLDGITPRNYGLVDSNQNSDYLKHFAVMTIYRILFHKFCNCFRNLKILDKHKKVNLILLLKHSKQIICKQAGKKRFWNNIHWI